MEDETTSMMNDDETKNRGYCDICGEESLTFTCKACIHYEKVLSLPLSTMEGAGQTNEEDKGYLRDYIFLLDQFGLTVNQTKHEDVKENQQQ
jgi:hypothetical protein